MIWSDFMWFDIKFLDRLNGYKSFKRKYDIKNLDDVLDAWHKEWHQGYYKGTYNCISVFDINGAPLLHTNPYNYTAHRKRKEISRESRWWEE